MRPRTFNLAAFTLSTAMVFGVAAIAADLPKEGTFSGTYSAFGTYKPTAIGKELLLSAWDENGLSIGNGFLDHMSWHCWGLYDSAKGMAQSQGYCVATDPDGDQIVVNGATDGRYPADAKSFKIAGTLVAGTGKFAGISGRATFLVHNNEFRPTAEGTYLHDASPVQGSYKLP